MLMRATMHIGVVVVCGMLANSTLAQVQSPLPSARTPQWNTVFESAEFVLSEERQPPGDAAGWERAVLPDQWRFTRPGASGWGWYRVQVEFDRAPTASHAIYLVHRRAAYLAIYINGALLLAEGNPRGRANAPGRFGVPVFVTIPASMMRAGGNVIHFRVLAASDHGVLHGLNRVAFGDRRPIAQQMRRANTWNIEAKRFFFGAALGVGMITAFLWFARRRDAVMLWFSISLLAWAGANALWLTFRWWDSPVLQEMADLFTFYGLVVPTAVLALRMVGLRWPRIEFALWVFLAAEIARPLWWDEGGALWRYFWPVANALILFGASAIVWARAARPLGWAYRAEIVALLVMGALMGYEFLRYLGWIDVDSTVIRHYHVPVMMLAIGAAIFDRHVAAVWRMEQSNLELERRVAEKAREIESYHAQRAEISRQQVLAYERQRIITDMHDGLGASLVGLLRYAQAQKGDPQIEQRIKEALQELRIAIDALEPSEGDLGAVLGNLRYRLEPLLEPSGIRLEWDVAELPRFEALEPSAVFALQRIVLEAVANALKHSGATRIRLTAKAALDGGAEIRVEDDGRGFDAAHAPSGLGLANMRARATRIGAQFDIASSPSNGTVVQLLVPRALARSPDDSASPRPDPRVLHDLLPAPGVA